MLFAFYGLTFRAWQQTWQRRKHPLLGDMSLQQFMLLRKAWPFDRCQTLSYMIEHPRSLVSGAVSVAQRADDDGLACLQRVESCTPYTSDVGRLRVNGANGVESLRVAFVAGRQSTVTQWLYLRQKVIYNLDSPVAAVLRLPDHQ